MPRTTKFKAVPYPIVGPSSESASLRYSAQRTINLYPELGQDGVTPTMLREFPGLKLLAAGTIGEFDRGTHVFKNVLYQVAGGELYTINSVGTRTSIGSINGTQPVSMSNNGIVMVIVTELSVYTYDGALLTTITVTPQPTAVDFLNSQFIFTHSDGTFGVTDVGTTTVSAYGTPESKPDGLVVVRIFNQFLYAFGESTIEPWQNVASAFGELPFARMNGQITESVGLAARDAVTNTENALYFISDRGEPNVMPDFTPKRISNPAISEQWRNYTISDSRVETAQFASLNFIIFTFPTDQKTWCYVEQYDFWFELHHDTAGSRWVGASITEAYGKTFVSDFANGNVYELDEDTYTNNGVTRAYERVMAPISGSKLGEPGSKYKMSSFRIEMETGIGNAAEMDPILEVSYSTDGGQTFGSSSFVKDAGQAGQFLKVMKTYTNRYFRNLTIKLRMTEPTKCRFYNASLDVRVGGR